MMSKSDKNLYNYLEFLEISRKVIQILNHENYTTELFEVL